MNHLPLVMVLSIFLATPAHAEDPCLGQGKGAPLAYNCRIKEQEAKRLGLCCVADAALCRSYLKTDADFVHVHGEAYLCQEEGDRKECKKRGGHYISRGRCMKWQS